MGKGEEKLKIIVLPLLCPGAAALHFNQLGHPRQAPRLVPSVLCLSLALEIMRRSDRS